MNLNMITPETETEDLLLSITKNCETLIEKTHRKAEVTLEFKMIKPRETFHFNPPIRVEEDWMIGYIIFDQGNPHDAIQQLSPNREIHRDPFVLRWKPMFCVHDSVTCPTFFYKLFLFLVLAVSAIESSYLL